jgi:hypothetical protein
MTCSEVEALLRLAIGIAKAEITLSITKDEAGCESDITLSLNS